MISLPNSIKLIKTKDNIGVFEIKPLYPGYGITIGNSLRRVLLSSLPGAAITQVKIKDVPHEFSVVPGIKEDIVAIIMNLKKLRFKMYTEEPQLASLSVKGKKKVDGGCFKLPSQLELVNKKAYIAELTSSKAKLEMEVQVEKGVGYVPVERRDKKKLSVGVIALDAIFSPVKRVAFNVENIIFGKRADFDKLNLEVETDGTITPAEAVYKASEILKEHYNLIMDSFSDGVKKGSKKEKKK